MTPQFTESQNSFPKATKPHFLNLIGAKARFRDMEVAGLSAESLQKELRLLDELEVKVMTAWADETRSINPGMLAEVKSGRCRYTLKKERFLEQQINNSME